jgi:histidinol-phosphate aminotransferase
MLATHAAIAAYDETDFFEFSLNKNKEALNTFYKTFDELGLEYRKSYTNFVFFKSGKHIDEFGKDMLGRGYIVGRPFPPYYEWCRISTGRVEDVKAFCEELKRYYS